MQIDSQIAEHKCRDFTIVRRFTLPACIQATTRRRNFDGSLKVGSRPAISVIRYKISNEGAQVYWSPILARFLAMFLLSIFSVIALAAPPKLNSNPVNEPAAIVTALLARDWWHLRRYTGWNEVEYTQLFESFPAYIATTVKGPNGKPLSTEVVPTFGRCNQTIIIQDIKVKEVLQAPDPTAPINQPRGLANEVLVIVQAQVLAIYLYKLDAVPKEDRCSWLGLEVRNSKTGKTESFFDNVDDDKALLKKIKSFGKLENNYVVVDPDRRSWTYAIPMVLPRSGKGLTRHFVKRTETTSQAFVDATEPRWLIQEPYAPEGVHIDVAIGETIRDQKYWQGMALSSCGSAVAKSLGIEFKKAAQDLKHPACMASIAVENNLSRVAVHKERFQTLQRIKLELKP